MIWSTNTRELTTQVRRLETSGMLHTTSIKPLPSKEVSAQEVPYFVIPRNAHNVGRLVVAFAHLTQRGFLDTTTPYAFGVTERPTGREKQGDEINEIARKQLRETHVITEKLALERGIFTPYGRSSAELSTLSYIGATTLPHYLDDRIAHLESLHDETLEGSDFQNRRDRMATELARGIQTLNNVRADL